MKKTLAIFLSLVIFASMAVTSIAAVSPIAPATLKSFTFTSTSLPSGFLANYGSSTIEQVADGTEGVLSVSTTEDNKDYNFWFVNSTNALSVSGEIVLSYDVKIISVDEYFKDSEAIVNPHLCPNTNLTDYIDQQYLPSAYIDREENKIVFKAVCDTDEEKNFINHNSFTGDLGKWYTVRYDINTTNGSIKTYVIDRETGNRAFVSEKNGLTIASLGRLNFTARGKATYLFDNLKVYSGAVDASSYDVNYFDTQNGLNLTVNLTDNVKRAELKADGILLETIENIADGVYNIINTSLNTVKTYKLELLCYDSNGNVIETVSKKMTPSVIISKTLLSENATEKTISTNTDTLVVQKRGQAVIETEYEIKFSEGLTSFNQEPRFFNQDGSGQSFGGAVTWTKIIESGVFKFSKEAYTPNKWYKIRTIFDSFNFTVTAYVDDGNGEKMAYTGSMSDRDYKYGYYLNKVCISGGTATIKNGSVREIFTLNDINAVSYVNYFGKALSIEETIPASTKAVNISLGDIALTSLDGVKLYKDGVEVTGITKNVSNDILTIAPEAFEAGNYKVEISGTTYGGIATNLVFAEEFKVVDEFAVLSPENGKKLSSDKISIAVSTLNCEKLEIYANNVLKHTANNPETVYVYEYTPENYGMLKIDAVATLSDGANETDTVYVDVTGTVQTAINPSAPVNYVPGDNTLTKTATTDIDNNTATHFVSPNGGGDGYSSTDPGYIYVNANKNTYNGIVNLKYNIKFDEVSSFRLKSEGKIGDALGSEADKYRGYPLNSEEMFNYGNVKKATSEGGNYAYVNDTWYTVEISMDMRNNIHSVYITNRSTGEKTTLCEDLEFNESYSILEGYGLVQFKYNMLMNNATANKGFTISNFILTNEEYIPTMGNITYSDKTSTNGMIEPCSSIEIALDGTGFDGDVSQYITLTKNDVTQEAEISYADGKITVIPDGGFLKNNRYKLTISGDATVKGKTINIPVSKEITVAENGLYISPLNIVKGTISGTYNALINYYNYNEAAQDGILVLASYSDKTMKKVSFSIEDEFATGYGTFNAEITGVASGETVKAMLWNNTSALTPLTGSLAVTAQ